MYLNYCRELKFDQEPDYLYLRQSFRILTRTLNYKYDYNYDWTILKEKEKEEASQGNNNSSQKPAKK
jgi:casein kinase 1 alpha